MLFMLDVFKMVVIWLSNMSCRLIEWSVQESICLVSSYWLQKAQFGVRYRFGFRIFRFAIVGRLFKMILFLREYSFGLLFCEFIMLVSWRILKGGKLRNVLSWISLLKVWIESIFVQNFRILSSKRIWFYKKEGGK